MNFNSKSLNECFLFSDEFFGHKPLNYQRFNFKVEAIEVNFTGLIIDEAMYISKYSTFGKIFIADNLKPSSYIKAYSCLIAEIANEYNVKRLVYKSPPEFLMTLSDQMFTHFLETNGAKNKSELWSYINVRYFRLNKGKKASVKKALTNGIECKRVKDNSNHFYQILENNLDKRYDVKPLHTLEEIKYFMTSDGVMLYEARSSSLGPAAYIMLWKYTDVIYHTQYITSTEEGRKLGSVDALISFIISDLPGLEILSFGTSAEEDGSANLGLLDFKASFGSKGMSHSRTYEYCI